MSFDNSNKLEKKFQHQLIHHGQDEEGKGRANMENFLVGRRTLSKAVTNVRKIIYAASSYFG